MAERQIIKHTEDEFIIEMHGTFCNKPENALDENIRAYYRWHFSANSPDVKCKVNLKRKNHTAYNLTLFDILSDCFTGNTLFSKIWDTDNLETSVVFHLNTHASFSLPQSITLESGNIRIRLDGKKRYNINRIEWKNQICAIDSPYAHYGMTCRPRDFQYAVGSGHEETGFGEKILSIHFLVDEKNIIPQENSPLNGKRIKMVKISKILDLKVKYELSVENGVLEEYIECVAQKNMNLHHLYFFMHPWSPRFTDLYVNYGNGTTSKISFRSKDTFPVRKFAPYAAWYDEKSGIGTATFFRGIKGMKKMQRLIWDRPQYRKDYLCDFASALLPAGHVISYKSRTVFFSQTDQTKWISDAEKLFERLK